VKEPAQRPPMGNLITLLTDFGWNGGYVAVCEAVIASVAPAARVLHLCHEIGTGDVRAGAMVLRRVIPFCPQCVHLAVIDPDVGMDRRPLALTVKRGDILIGPDNGLLLPAAEILGGVAEAWLLDAARVRHESGLATTIPSSTFHGRDLFAPAAALVCAGLAVSLIATPADPLSLVHPSPPVWHATTDGVLAEVMEIDRFGNVELAVRFDALAPSPLITPGDSFSLEIQGKDLPKWKARVVETFGQLQPGELGLLRDSWGHVALALNGTSAAEFLSVKAGMTIQLTADKGVS
jgi:S-adenosylmethionine hydrolase